MFLLLPLAMIASSEPPPVVAPPLPATAAACSAPRPRRIVDAAPPVWLATAVPGVSTFAVGDEPTDAPRPLELWRAADGLFYVDGAINGHRVRFVVDTGASMVVLTARDARRAGVTVSNDTPLLEAKTAAGKSSMAMVTLGTMQVGGTGVTAAPAVIAPEGLDVSLLGQSWLSHLASVTIEGDRMTLR